MSHDLKPSKILSHRYKLREIIGDGTFSIIWLAEDMLENRNVALKILKDERLTNYDPERSQQYKRYFDREIKVLEKFNHNHIVKCYDSFYVDGLDLPCIVLEHLNLGDLHKFIKDKGSLGVTESLKYIQHVGSALAYLHHHNHLHHDIKPKNIVIRQSNINLCEAVLIDLGQSKEFIRDRQLEYSTVPGTYDFSPPELTQHTKIIKQAENLDVYSLAATLYYLLTGKSPVVKPSNAYPSNIHKDIIKAIEIGMSKASERPQYINEWLDLLPLSSADIYRYGNKVIEFNCNDPNQKTWEPLLGNQPLNKSSHKLSQVSSFNELSIPQTNNKSLNSDNNPEQFDIVKKLLSNQNYNEVLNICDDALNQNPNNQSFLLNKAYAFLCLGSYENAICSYETAIDLGNCSYQVWSNYSYALFYIKDYDKSLIASNKAIEIESSMPELYYNQGNILFCMKRYDEAKDFYEKSIQLRDDYVEAWNGKGASLLSMFEYESALSAFNIALEISPDFETALENKKRTEHKIKLHSLG